MHPARSPLRTARVRAAPASEPEPGSVRPQRAQRLAARQPRQVLLLLRLVAGQVDVPGAERVVRRHRQPDGRVGAGHLLQRDRRSRGTSSPRRRTSRGSASRAGPSRPAPGSISCGKRSSSSQRRALGMIRRSHISRTDACRTRCSSDSSKSIICVSLSWPACRPPLRGAVALLGTGGREDLQHDRLVRAGELGGVRLAVGDVQRLVGGRRGSSRCRR